MIDRAAFDRQIDEIRNRYKKICNQQQSHVQQTTSHPSNPEPHSNPFATPLKLPKNQYNEQFVSFSKTRDNQPPPAAQEGNQKVSLLTTRKRYVEVQNGQTERICLTTRQTTSKVKDLSSKIQEKQRLLSQRMMQNQRLLRMSKQLREGESRNASALKVDKPASNDQTSNRRYLSLERQKALDIENLSFKIPPPPPKQNSYSLSTTKKTEKGIKALPQNKEALQQYYTNLKMGLHRRIEATLQESDQNRVKFPTKLQTPQIQKDRQTLAISSGQKRKIETKAEQVYGPEDLKITSVFENTAKIQERIRAILSFH